MGAGVPLGPYRLVRRLATGGMAEIFLARQEGKDGFSRDLVVKRILPHLAVDAEFKRMFQGEARLAAQLSHPNVVHVYDYGSVVEPGGDETFYLAMELVRGVDLRALIVRAAESAVARGETYALPPHHAAKIASFVCEALAYAHELVVDGKRANIVHRDVTPSNVLLSFDGAVKLADFGIAKSVASDHDATEHGVVKGKYSYLSPEQARGEALDRRSDLFNVGILLFESILGQPLFPHQDAKLAKRISARGEIPDRLRIRRMPPPLAEVAERALAPNASDRFPDALAMRAELEAYVRKSAEPSDTVEIGRFVRQLFPETVAEDRRAVRAAGTIARSDVPPAVRARTAVLADPAGRSSETSLEETESDPTLLSSASFELGSELLDPTPAPVGGTAPTPIFAPAVSAGLRGPIPLTSVPAARPLSLEATPVLSRPASGTRAGVWIAAALIVVGASLGAAAMLVHDDGPPPPPSRPPPPPSHATLSAVPVVTAELHVASDPVGATIEVDGTPIGLAPITSTVTATAPHVVRALDASGRELSRADVRLAEHEIRELTMSALPVTASLRVTTTPPGASVRVDGDLLGETPLSVDVAPSPHHVEVALLGYEPVGDDVSFAGPGEQAMLSFALRRQASSRPPDRHPPSTPATRATGTLRIATDPYSEVYEGSRHLGTTPLQITLPVGHHRLSLRSPGHAARTTDVDIRENDVTRLRLSL
jgi:serine/threonine-protein kinase